MVEPEHHGVGGQDFERGLLAVGQRLRGPQLGAIGVERLEVVVVRVEPVARQPDDRIDELAETCRVAPLRLELLRLVVARHCVAEHDAFAADRMVAVVVLHLVAQVVHPLTDGLAERIHDHDRRRGGRREWCFLAPGDERRDQRETGEQGVQRTDRHWRRFLG